ncbi:L-serine ammonia-lyase [Altericroceibacterium endophyticum]|uniref:L-serine dehydratase n=1 Tax=Altericroceibacterium endophyticum TaxID=1808508 RepID=A0A6I4T8R4_9SPHN|nr:L-serine ammonia-lyase [Altericroceibacterium endophyticum]MXO66662.1 L-serine ammonia-lyase [Altericroceibacterium endophyticum]
MPVSLFELFKVGVGPSSSHTMGPMSAAQRFVSRLAESGNIAKVTRVETTLYASLALTGLGHATDTAIMIGLHGLEPHQIDPDEAVKVIADLRDKHQLPLGGAHLIPFEEKRDILWRGREKLPFHPNGMQFRAFDDAGELVEERAYYSVGGGFVLDQDETRDNSSEKLEDPAPYPYRSAAELMNFAKEQRVSIADIALANEDARRPREETLAWIEQICSVMSDCIDRGLDQSGTLPGGLNITRRAAKLRQSLADRLERILADPLSTLDWINLWAIAVNEENSAGGRVVTAPTNGAAGIIPSVLRYYDRYHAGTAEGRATFVMTATAIGGLYKSNASISAAEVGCQGEVGVACSMAAAGLCAVLGGTNEQIENAAEIGMEHNLGLTCDPIGGLVQIPCIERNAMGAVKAIDAARLALASDGIHHVSLDQVIDTMRRTGADMKDSYKETSLGGLAVYRPAC